MPRWFNIVFQVSALLAQVWGAVGGAVPPKFQWIFAAVLAAVQGSVAVVAHHYNPDGTPAAQAYRG